MGKSLATGPTKRPKKLLSEYTKWAEEIDKYNAGSRMFLLSQGGDALGRQLRILSTRIRTNLIQTRGSREFSETDQEKLREAERRFLPAMKEMAEKGAAVVKLGELTEEEACWWSGWAAAPKEIIDLAEKAVTLSEMNTETIDASMALKTGVRAHSHHVNASILILKEEDMTETEGQFEVASYPRF